jgi:heme/copper-type cytochrome/quinol oxidase subunit 2
MKQDTIGYDSLEARPLPKWLTNQRDGLNTYQPQQLEMKEDHSLQISLISTGIVILITVLILTIYFLRKNKRSVK